MNEEISLDQFLDDVIKGLAYFKNAAEDAINLEKLPSMMTEDDWVAALQIFVSQQTEQVAETE